MAKQSRRAFMVQTGQVMLGTAIGTQLLTAQAGEPGEHAHGEHGEHSEHAEHAVEFVTAAGVAKICVNCEYWGGVRKISPDGHQISGYGTGWCNNPASMRYQKQTAPDAGPMPAWKKWGALS